MSVLFFLIGCSLLVAVAFLWLFGWAVRSGQYDDTVTPAYRALFDAPESAEPKEPNPTAASQTPT